MDMKKILQAFDGASSKKPAEGSNDMKRFMQIVEGKGPLNRLTQAESIVMQDQPAKKTITNPVLNIEKNAKPSMIGKYFKTIQEEISELDQKNKNRARLIAERVIERVTPGQETPPGINRLTGKPNEPEPTPAPTNIKPGFSTVEYGGSTYSVLGVFGDGIRPRIGRSDKVIPAKAYVVGDKMYVLLDVNVQEDSLDEKCWDTHKQVGMKKKGDRMVPNCVPKEDVDVDESGLQYYTGVKKHGAEYMKKAAEAGRKGASQAELGALKDKYSKAFKGKKANEAVQQKGPAGQFKGKDKTDVKGTVLGSPEKSQKGLRNKLVGGGA